MKKNTLQRNKRGKSISTAVKNIKNGCVGNGIPIKVKRIVAAAENLYVSLVNERQTEEIRELGRAIREYKKTQKTDE